jgi:rubredoxin
MMPYACLGCGLIFDGEITKSRYDFPGCNAGPYPSRPFHGWVYERICPECGHKELVEMSRDVA